MLVMHIEIKIKLEFQKMEGKTLVSQELKKVYSLTIYLSRDQL